MRYNLKISLLLAAILAIATGYPQQESRPGCLITPDEMRAYTDEVRMHADALKQADKLHFYPVERLDADSISIEKFLDLNYLGWPLRNANYSDFPGWAIGNFKIWTIILTETKTILRTLKQKIMNADTVPMMVIRVLT